MVNFASNSIRSCGSINMRCRFDGGGIISPEAVHVGAGDCGSGDDAASAAIVVDGNVDSSPSLAAAAAAAAAR